MATTPTIPSYESEEGAVTGATVRTRGLGGKIVAGLQSLVGGEVASFTREIEKAREEAIERLKVKAKRMGANAVLGVDIETSDVFESVVLVSATGTAAVVEPE